GEGRENPYLLQQELQEAMQDGAGLARDEKSLKACLDRVLELRQRSARVHVPGSRRYNPGWHTARDLRFMLTIAEAIVRAAIERKESRGAHWRLDYLEMRSSSRFSGVTRTAARKSGSRCPRSKAWSCSTPSTTSRHILPTTSHAVGTARRPSAAPAAPRSMAGRG